MLGSGGRGGVSAWQKVVSCSIPLASSAMKMSSVPQTGGWLLAMTLVGIVVCLHYFFH